MSVSNEGVLMTPTDLTITPRDRRFGRDRRAQRHWLNGDPIATAFFNALSITFPRGEAFFIETDNAAGKLEIYRVAYVFGVEPLQQYLLPLGNGRLQALSVAWDTRPESEGGQRWYHLYPDEHITAGDPLHWTGGFFNWNTSCAECHSTDVDKRYDALNDRFDTHYEQIDVGCEACHGPGSEHVALADAGSLSPAETGFAMSLKARGTWQWTEGADIAQRSEPLTTNYQIDSCARCHARRGTLGEYHPGKPLLDTHRLAVIEEPLYWPDGQIRDEVYVYGSFIQSKMHQAGVTCTNCHNPHSNQLVAEGNSVWSARTCLVLQREPGSISSSRNLPTALLQTHMSNGYGQAGAGARGQPGSPRADISSGRTYPMTGCCVSTTPIHRCPCSDSRRGTRMETVSTGRGALSPANI